MNPRKPKETPQNLNKTQDNQQKLNKNQEKPIETKNYLERPPKLTTNKLSPCYNMQKQNCVIYAVYYYFSTLQSMNVV